MVTLKGRETRSVTFKAFCLSTGATKYTDKDNGGMLVWSPYHSVPDAKCKSTTCTDVSI